MISITAEDLRAEVARKQVPLYKLAAQIGLHPGRLGMMLGGRLALPPGVADRVLAVLAESERRTVYTNNKAWRSQQADPGQEGGINPHE